jgi:ATP-binding cassette subfamily F protein 3
MSVLSAENLSLSFGDFDLFRGISLSIANDAKVGMIGPNGVGKTSLLRMLAGLSQPSTGKVYLARGRRIGYLRQEAMDAFADHTNTVFQEMLAIFTHLEAQEKHLSALEAEMARGSFSAELLEEYGLLQEAFEKAGGYDYELRIRQTLQGLGLGKDTWEMPLDYLSGGQKTRALLARLLLEKPDLLMLDEPTNHLDITAVEWLEGVLRDWQGAVLIVSHDRFFLDSVVNTIWEMTPYSIVEYPGNYSAYLQQRQDRWEWTVRIYKEEKERLLKEVDFVERNWVRASTHARALGMLRKLTRELAIVDQYGLLALRNGTDWHETGIRANKPLDMIEAVRKVNAIQMPGSRPSSIRPRLVSTQTSGNIVLRAKHAQIGYPKNSLFRIADLELHRGECAALIGPNGSGKTTFLKVLLGQLQTLSGEVRLGAGLKTGYFSQAQDALNEELPVLDELQRHLVPSVRREGKETDPQEARSYLARYLFRGDDVFKPVGALSGGERARLALAILGLEGANFLLLDEPTNHLDIPAREALQEVLSDFNGTILLVSHDRYLIDQLATQIWEIQRGRLEVFQGNYREYVLRRLALAKGPIKQKTLLNKPLIKVDSRADRKRMEQLNQLEGRIREQESTVQRLSRELHQVSMANDHEKTHQMSWQMAQAQAHLEDLMAEWERMAV